jgi:hypothetical protein
MISAAAVCRFGDAALKSGQLDLDRRPAPAPSSTPLPTFSRTYPPLLLWPGDTNRARPPRNGHGNLTCADARLRRPRVAGRCRCRYAAPSWQAALRCCREARFTTGHTLGVACTASGCHLACTAARAGRWRRWPIACGGCRPTARGCGSSSRGYVNKPLENPPM